MEFEDITYFLDNNQSMFSVICVRFMYTYLALCYIIFFFNPTPFVFFKDISCLDFVEVKLRCELFCYIISMFYIVYKWFLKCFVLQTTQIHLKLIRNVMKILKVYEHSHLIRLNTYMHVKIYAFMVLYTSR